MLKTFFLCFVGIAPVLAQSPFGFGLKAGVPLNDALSVDPSAAVSYIQNTHRYIIGPFVEVRLPARFSVEVDALYRSYDYRQVPRFVSTSVSPGLGNFQYSRAKPCSAVPSSPTLREASH